MLLLIQKEDIENLIGGQKNAIKLYFVFALIILGVGLLMLFFANNLSIPDSTKTIVNIGGGFVSTLSGFPIKEIINRREKIVTYGILKRHVILIAEKGDEIEKKEKEEILELIMQIIKKNALKL
jgi:hypothetical protein